MLRGAVRFLATGAIALVLCWELGPWVDETEGQGTKETLVTSAFGLRHEPHREEPRGAFVAGDVEWSCFRRRLRPSSPTPPRSCCGVCLDQVTDRSSQVPWW